MSVRKRMPYLAFTELKDEITLQHRVNMIRHPYSSEQTVAHTDSCGEYLGSHSQSADDDQKRSDKTQHASARIEDTVESIRQNLELLGLRQVRRHGPGYSNERNRLVSPCSDQVSGINQCDIPRRRGAQI